MHSQLTATLGPELVTGRWLWGHLLAGILSLGSVCGCHTGEAREQQRHSVGMNNLAQVREVWGFMGTYFVPGLRVTLTHENGSGLGEDLTFKINCTKISAQSYTRRQGRLQKEGDTMPEGV